MVGVFFFWVAIDLRNEFERKFVEVFLGRIFFFFRKNYWEKCFYFFWVWWFLWEVGIVVVFLRL